MSTYQHFHQHNYEQREKILPAVKILSRFSLKENQRLADLGCGQGYFALKAAEIVGVQGAVKAVDIVSEQLQVPRHKAQECGLAERIETYLAHGESIPLPDRDMDRGLIANVLHELKDPLNFLRDTRRILKSDGEVWVIEWQKKETPMGPPLKERRSLEEWITMLEQAGFEGIWVQIFNPTHLLLRGKVSEPI